MRKLHPKVLGFRLASPCEVLGFRPASPYEVSGFRFKVLGAKVSWAVGRGLWIMALLFLLSACYETRYLPEGEVLYTGVSDITYGKPGTGKKKQKSVRKEHEEGVITAVAEAYNEVEGFLMGMAPSKQMTELLKQATPQQRDSIEKAMKVDMETREQIKEEIDAVLSIAPNNGLLGSARVRFPLPVGLWFYNRYVGSHTKVGKWLFNTFAADPKFITTVNPRIRAQVAQNVLHNYGFFGGQVLYEVQEQKNPRKAKVSYTVLPGMVHRFDSIDYQQFSPQADSLIHSNMRKTELRRTRPFTTLSLDAERNRLSEIFRNNGYYYCQPNYFTYRADTLQRPGWVQLQVRPSRDLPAIVGRRYYLRNTHIYLTDVEGDGVTFTDSLGRRGAVKMYYDGTAQQKSPLRFGVLRRWILYEKGDLYRQRLQDFIQEKISSLGVFSAVTTDYVPCDTTSTCDSLDVIIRLRLDKPYDAEFKANAATKSNGYVGPGLSFSMSKRNAFRGAETLGFRAYGSYEWMTGANANGRPSVLNSYEYGTSVSLDYPYIRLFGLGRKYLSRTLSSTSYKIEANWLNRAAYFGRVSLGAHVDYTLQRKPTEKHELTLFRLDYNVQLRSTEAFDSIAAANQALYVSMRNQFVPSMQYIYTLSSRRTARNPRSLVLTFKEAGNLTSGIYAATGASWSQKDKQLFGVPFAQYVKATAEFTDRIRLFHTHTYLAFRLMGGAVVSYGNARIAPYNDLFSIGGANSIRAFSLRSIGPGSYNPARSGYSYIDQMGDLKFEANLEYRFPVVGSLAGALFMDTGNVWLMRNNEDHPGGAFRLRNLGRELALGTGFGFRYDLDFIVVRFDVGVGIHAPYDTGKSGYYNMPRFWKSLGYHFAIGYPF